MFPGEDSGERYGRREQCDVARGGHAHRRKFHEYQGVLGRRRKGGEDNQNHGAEERHRTAVLRD